ncbi:Protein CBG26070 [Caenorhabditis briggsae]|uniref:Protein CBG26070 n=1 Tax=Caenorhabditis briggsae TaxID=6238 RepID=B6ILQ3_CAEBR|nr:Protein CBG26070 [Caenorhabditis briggsae]CAS00833.1 Protein CBG26070 [Caenorhabditis briggsae]
MSKKSCKTAQKLEICPPKVAHLPVAQKIEELLKCIVCTQPSKRIKFGYALCGSCANFYRKKKATSKNVPIKENASWILWPYAIAIDAYGQNSKRLRRKKKNPEEDSGNQSKTVGSQSKREKKKMTKGAEKTCKNTQKLEISLPDVDHLPVDQKVEQLMKCLICTKPSPHVKFGYALCRSCSNFYRYHINIKKKESDFEKCANKGKCVLDALAIRDCYRCIWTKFQAIEEKKEESAPVNKKQKIQDPEDSEDDQSDLEAPQEVQNSEDVEISEADDEQDSEDDDFGAFEEQQDFMDDFDVPLVPTQANGNHQGIYWGDDSDDDQVPPANNSQKIRKPRYLESSDSSESYSDDEEPIPKIPLFVISDSEEDEANNRQEFGDEDSESDSSDSSSDEESEPEPTGPNDLSNMKSISENETGEALENKKSEKPSKKVRFLDEIEAEHRRQGTSGLSEEGVGSSGIPDWGDVEEPGLEASGQYISKAGSSEKIPKASGSPSHRISKTSGADRSQEADDDLSMNGIDYDQMDEQDNQDYVSHQEQIQRAAGGQDGQDEVPGIEEDPNVGHESSRIHENVKANDQDGRDGLVEDAEASRMLKDLEADGQDGLVVEASRIQEKVEVANGNQAIGIQEGQVGGQNGQADGPDEQDDKDGQDGLDKNDGQDEGQENQDAQDRIEVPDTDQDGQGAQDEQNENLPKIRSRKRECHITVESPEDQPLQKRPRIKMESSEIYEEQEPSDPIPEEPENVEELEEIENEEDDRPPSPFEGIEIGIDDEIHLNNPEQLTGTFDFRIFNNSKHRIAFYIGFNNPAFLKTPNQLGSLDIGGVSNILIQFNCNASELGNDKMFLKFVIFDGKLDEDIFDSFRDETKVWKKTISALFSE